MKTLPLLLASLTLTSGWASAQTPSATPAPAPASTPTPAPASSKSSEPDAAKLAEFSKRFAAGQALEQQGKLAEARAVFDGIIADSPEAKGSLREAGIISVRLNELEKANSYFDQLHTLVPEYPAAIESLIQINQSLKKDVKVEILLKEFRDLHTAGKVPLPYFVRERLHLDQGQEMVFTEFFDYKQPPNTVWMAELFDSDGRIKRRFLLNYDPHATSALREKDPTLVNAEQFLLIEDVLKDGEVTQVDAYFQMFALPEYKKIRNTMLAISGGAYKPVYSQPVGSATP